MPTDAELRDAAVVHLKETTVGFKNKHWKIPPAGSEWKQALALLDQIGVPEPPEPPLPVGPRLWADNSPINTPIGANPSVVLGYGQGPLNGLPGIGFNGGGWGVAIFRDTSGSRRTVSNSDGWKLDNVPAPSQYAAYVNAMAALGDTERHSVIFDRDRAHNIYGANPALTTALAMGELRPAGSGSGTTFRGRGSVGRPAFARRRGRCSSRSSTPGTFLTRSRSAGRRRESPGRPGRHANTFVAPATSSDGSGRNRRRGDGLTVATRSLAHRRAMRAFGISDLLPPVAKAMQRYGAYVADSTGWMTVYAESWNDAGRVNWDAGWHPGSVQLIPHLRIVAAPPAPVYDDRTTFGQPHK